MKLRIIYLLIIISVLFSTAAYAAEPNFAASSLTAKDVDCRKCHTDPPHIIHASKPVECVNCHGDKKSVTIPQCTKCHDGLIHKVHAGKVSTQKCDYCHKTIPAIHAAFLNEAVCSHCHKDLIVVHGNDSACSKCHKSPPDIVKPLKAAGMILICQDCHTNASVASIHGTADDKKGCYNCHKGNSNAVGSEIPHLIHATKVDCKSCHEDNGKVVVPKCTKCHDIDKLHAFDKIGKLTAQNGLNCSACHPKEVSSSTVKAAPLQTASPQTTEASVQTVTTTETVQAQSQSGEKPKTQEPESVKTPGFEGIMAIAILLCSCVLIKRRWK